jgi:hypothetical protein
VISVCGLVPIRDGRYGQSRMPLLLQV